MSGVFLCNALMIVDIITIFPEMVQGFLGESMMKRASDAGHVQFRFVNPRDFTTDVHRTVDDRPYGGGPGMVMKPEPLFAAVESVRTDDSRVILMAPQGRPFKQSVARELVSQTHLIFICGHYEGIDERVRMSLINDEISIGDYILTNGALAATVIVDAVVRLLPGVLGAGDEGTSDESFTVPLLEYPQYTRPVEFRGIEVPDVLRSGNHGAIAQWRYEQSVAITRRLRPDLLSGTDDEG